jgi:hypothetical protein
VPGTHFDSEQRLSLILETQQAIAAAGDDLERLMQIVTQRSTAILGADGAMVNLCAARTPSPASAATNSGCCCRS